MKDDHKGRLLVVATPLGNLKDITFRAVDALKRASFIAAEDTRRTRKLLAHLGIKTKIISCNEHNESKRVQLVLDVCNQGEDVVLVSDAGTPGISDPGAYLIRMLREKGVEVLPVPGPSAVACALSVCGMRANSYHFVGFLPSKKQERLRVLEQISSLESLLVFFEAPHRIVATLQDMLEIFEDRQAFLAKEMTKVHETYIFSNISDILALLSAEQRVKGEITLIVEGAVRPVGHRDEIPQGVKRVMSGLLSDSKMGVKEASALLSSICNIKKGALYQYALDLSKKGKDHEK